MSIEFKPNDLAFSIVILAEQNNPTILTPDFLKQNNIIDENWVLSDTYIGTPQFSSIAYRNGISISSNFQSISILDAAPNGDIFPVPDIAVAYLKNVPHVKYHSLGINFDGILVFEQQEQANFFTINRFLKPEILNKEFKITAFLPNLTISFDDAICNLSFQPPVKGVFEDANVFGIQFKANFHREFKQIDNHESRNETIIEKISNWKTDKNRYKQIIDNLIG